jgi:beta-galactosidase
MKLGVCYYPEHWSESRWADDASHMVRIGIKYVRIGEFAWSRIEPEPGHFAWDWLDRAIDTLGAAGLSIVMCTPTATPPKWLVDAHPDILAVDRHGQPRRFGSRRHYCFSSLTYRRESARITRAIAERYGHHPGVCAWQTDNEYGCHDTVLSYSQNAAIGFRLWLKERHGSIEALNLAWGGVFWSQEYRSFEEIDPPFQAVTEASPSHRLDYQRFASDEVAAFNRIQVDLLRALSPGRGILHNYMGASTAFDHFDIARDLDIATWDSYPLGFLEQGPWPDQFKARFMRQGHPDFTAFHHDLYRGVGQGRWWVMEQQPGPVNWAPWNPAPLPGMVRAWTWEAFAHGAEVVSYFRWRQAPFAQEQMHAGLQTPDGGNAPGMHEVGEVAAELSQIGALATQASPVALIFDYAAKWILDIQPQGADFDYAQLALDFYAAARRLGLDVDIVGPDADLSGYGLILAPTLPVASAALVERLAMCRGEIVLGPRSGSKTPNLQIAEDMPPGNLRSLMPVRVARVESLRRGWVEPGDYAITRWLEHTESEHEPRARTASGHGIWHQHGRVNYLSAWPDATLLNDVLREAAVKAGLETLDLPDGLRLRRCGDVRFAINYSPEAVDIGAYVRGTEGFDFLIGERRLDPAGVAAWRER